MKTANRRLRFRQRLELERNVLSEVNGSLPIVRPLTGITEIAVLQWCRDLELKTNPAYAQRISNIIIEIARRSSFDADCSRDIFVGEELVACDTVGELLARLKDAIKPATLENVS